MFFHRIIFGKQGRSHRPSPPLGLIRGFFPVFRRLGCQMRGAGPSHPGPAGGQAGGQRFANRGPCATVHAIRLSPHGAGGLGHDSLNKTDRQNCTTWAETDRKKPAQWRASFGRFAGQLSTAGVHDSMVRNYDIFGGNCCAFTESTRVALDSLSAFLTGGTDRLII